MEEKQRKKIRGAFVRVSEDKGVFVMVEKVKDNSLKEYGIEVLRNSLNGIYRIIKLSGWIIMGYVFYIGCLEMVKSEFRAIYESYGLPISIADKKELYIALLSLTYILYILFSAGKVCCVNEGVGKIIGNLVSCTCALVLVRRFLLIC